MTEQGQRTLSDADVSIARLEQEVVSLRGDVSELSHQVHDLVQAWNTARGMVKFVRVVGSIATAVAAVWALTKLGFSMAAGK